MFDGRDAAARRSLHDAPALLALCFAGFFLAGLLLRLHGIAAKPLWMDEVTTLKRAELPVAAMLRDSVRYHQLPAFFLITSWALHFGVNAFWLRMPAALFGALSCALGFAVAREIGGLKAGFAAGMLMALSPAMVQYGQEARSYTMVICAILIGLWGLLALARDASGKGSAAAWAGYVLGTIAALNILSVALFWWLGGALGGGFLAWRNAALRRRWLSAQALILAVCLPWFIAIKYYGQRGALGGLDWVPPLDWKHLWWAISGTYLLYVTSLIRIRIFAPAIPGLGVAVALLALAGLLALRRRSGQFAVLLLAVLCLPLGLLAVSLFTPVLMPRYLLWGAAPFFVWAGRGFDLLPRRLQLPSLALLALLLWINLAPYYRAETKPRWDLAAAELMAGWRPGDLLLVDDPQAVSMMNLYLRPKGEQLGKGWTTDLARALNWQSRGGRVWAVQGAVGQVDHENQAQFLQRIAPLGRPDFSEHAGLDILLLRFNGSKAAAGAK